MKILRSGLLVSLLLLTAVAALAAEPVANRLRPGQQAQGMSVYSIVPSQGEPGTQVTVNGSGFTPGTQLLLAGKEVGGRVLDARQLIFSVPALPAGQYALSVRTDDGSVRSYSFQIQSLRPVALALEPDQVTVCAHHNEREVTVRGRNFSEQAQLLFNGAIVRSTVLSSEAISFAVPPVGGGLHQVTVKNGDALATPLGLAVISAPTISSVARGADRVNQYELLIDGSNFQQNSVLMVDGVRVGGAGGVQEERLVVQNCGRMVYLRRPLSSSPRSLTLQVVNPSGESSTAFSVSAP